MLIIGCGDVGSRLAQRAKRDGQDVYCMVSTTQSAARLVENDLTTRAINLDDALPELDGVWNQADIFYFAPPPPSGRTDPRMQHFLQALPTTSKHRIVYISTTGVYGNCSGDWVSEGRAPNPQVDRAKRRFDAEQQLQAWRNAGNGEIVILRVAGIYGPNKLPLERLLKQVPMIGEDEAPWTNRIHIDDLVTICEAAMLKGRDGEVYNVSDGTPGNMRNYFDSVADRFGLPRPPLVRLDDAEGKLSAGLLSYLGESRRLDNRKMLDELHVTLRYPNLDSGLDDCHREMQEQQ